MGFRQLEVVVWKNFIIRKRHWFLTIIEAILPICLFLLIAYGRSQISGLNKIEVPKPSYNDLEAIRYDIAVGDTYILYTPGSDYYTNLISRMHTKLSMPSDQVLKFGSKEELLEYYYKNPNYTTIAIIFDNKNPKQLSYKIRYHEHYSFKHNFLLTADKFDKTYDFQPGRGGAYVSSGRDFINVQLALDMSFLEYHSNKTDLEKKYSVVTQEFPYPPYTLDYAINSIFLEFLPIISLFSFIFLCPAVLKRVVEEKYSGTKELMKMVGMQSWMLWLGWFIYAIIPMLVAILWIVIFMKVPIFGTDYPLIEHTNGGILFCFLLLYCTAAISFCFAISSFFSRPTTALVAGLLLWILSYFIPTYAFGLDDSNQLSRSTNIILNLLPNMALHYGYSVISVYEQREVGVQWNNYYTPGSGSPDDITMRDIYVMLLTDTFLYLLFTFYMDGVNPGKYGVRKKILFPINAVIKRFRKSPNTKVKIDCETTPLEKIEDAVGLSKGIEIKYLCKRFGHKVAVDNLHLDIYKNQITVLLGHNGAGKSTTMSIITGMLEATSGSVKINGSDINTDIDEIRQSLGLCPQHNLLFTDLTVMEHLLFFAKLKGKSSKEATEEAEELLKTMNMTDKKTSMANALSGGMQRKLCLGMAVIGGSKVLILDEPSSGMDPESRRHLWDLLLKWRGEKTILITTHFMEEADALGDWIAIMSNGSLNCYGTPMFLKKKYDTGYHLSLMIEEDANIDEIKANVLENSEAQLKSIDANNVIFVLPFEQNSRMTNLLTDLESKRLSLKIKNISVTITTLEDVFLKTNLETSGGGSTSTVDTQALLDLPDHQVSVKCQSVFKQLKTLSRKKVYFLRKKIASYILPVIVAILFFVLTVYLSRSNDYYTESGPELKLKLSTYRQTTVFYNGSKENHEISKMMNIYGTLVEDQNSLAVEVNNTEQSILKKSKENIAYYKEHLITGANFMSDFQLVALYNAIPLHSLPISINLITNTLSKSLLGTDFSISISNWPLPYVSERINSQELSEAKLAILWLILLPVGFLFIHGSFIIFPYTEISTKFVRLQYMSGVKPLWYWLVNFFIDMMFYLICAFILDLTLWLFSPMTFNHINEFGYLFLIFTLYGFAGIPFTYLFSRKKSVSGAFALFIIMGMFLGIFMTITIGILLQSQDDYYIHIGTVLKYICFIFIPQVGLTDALVTFVRRAVSIYNFNVTPNRLSSKCYENSHPCCNVNSVECIHFKNYTNLFNEHFLMLVGCIIYLLLNLFLDSYLLLKIRSAAVYRYHQIWVLLKGRKLAERGTTHPVSKNGFNSLNADKLSKLYGERQIVKNINLTLKHGQCLGILGVNGAGKTTTFRMLTREEMVDNGNVHVELGTKVINIGDDEYLQTLGYCPQSDSLNYVLTGKQILTAMAELRGIYDKEIVNTYLKLFDLEQYADVPCGYYSGGNKRKLSLAISLIGYRKFVLLDEPTNGVDPATRRKCWSLIKTMQTDKGFILTSHSMTECEALCNELKIMKDGKFAEEGTLVDLKNKYGGFTLKLKLSNKVCVEKIDVDEVDGFAVDGSENISLRKQFNNIEEIKHHFTKNNRGELKDEHSGLLHFYIKVKDGNRGWSEIFKEVEEIKANNSHLIEDYAISEASLEDIFLKVARTEELGNATNTNSIQVV